MTLTIVTNNHQRDLLSGYEISKEVWDKHFDYLGEYSEENENAMSPRFFHYGDWWYDANDFPRAEGEIALAGYDGFASDTFFSGIAIRYGKDWSGEPDYDSVVVARIASLD